MVVAPGRVVVVGFELPIVMTGPVDLVGPPHAAASTSTHRIPAAKARGAPRPVDRSGVQAPHVSQLIDVVGLGSKGNG